LRLHNVGMVVPGDIGAIRVERAILIGALIADFLTTGVVPAINEGIGDRLYLLMGGSTDLSIGSWVIVGRGAKSITTLQVIAIIRHSCIDDLGNRARYSKKVVICTEPTHRS